VKRIKKKEEKKGGKPGGKRRVKIHEPDTHSEHFGGSGRGWSTPPKIM
jgi:hypothetical protein